MIAHMDIAARRIFTLLLLVPILALVGAACGDDDGGGSDGSDGGSDTAAATDDGDASASKTSTGSDTADRADSYDEPPGEPLDESETYTVRMETNKGSFDITVLPKNAPIAAANFVALVKDGFYDDLTFHRIIDGFMVQAGDPLGDGTGGPGYQLEDDPVKGTYARGTVAMANAGPNTGGSQFFIVQGENVDASLPKDYVIFGKVDDAGMQVVDKIAKVEVEPGPSGEPSHPVDDVVITKAELVEPAGA